MEAASRQSPQLRDPLLVVWGVPGAGKSTFARWLSREKGFTHIDTDAGGSSTLELVWRAVHGGQAPPSALIDAVGKDPRPIVLEYGLYAEPGAIRILSTLRELGADPCWFDGDREAAFDAWRAENRKSSRPFADQLWRHVVDVIDHHWSLIEAFFGPKRILPTVGAGPRHVPQAAIYSMIFPPGQNSRG